MFPVGGGIVTTMPVKLALRHDPTTVDVKYIAPSRLSPGTADTHYPEPNLDHQGISIAAAYSIVDNLMKTTERDREDVDRAKGTEAEAKVRHATHYHHYHGGHVEITLRSPCVPTLDVVDLPGMRLAAEGHHAASVTGHYMNEAKKEKAIVLMVVEGLSRELDSPSTSTRRKATASRSNGWRRAHSTCWPKTRTLLGKDRCWSTPLASATARSKHLQKF